jgi:hypothetical protein
MTPHEFIRKWQGSTLRERQFCQEHFIDLCRLVDHPTPAEADRTGEIFAFEKGAAKRDGTNGWADVWKKDTFAFEYKGKHAVELNTSVSLRTVVVDAGAAPAACMDTRGNLADCMLLCDHPVAQVLSPMQCTSAT